MSSTGATPKSSATPYSPSVRVPADHDIVFVSGQLPLDPSGHLTSSRDIADQTRLALEGALAVLRHDGATAADVVKVTLFVRDLRRYDEINSAYLATLKDCRPARSTVEVSSLPRGALVEVEMVAAVPVAPTSPTFGPSK